MMNDAEDFVDLSDDESWLLRNHNLDAWTDPFAWAVDRLQWIASGGALLEANAEVVAPVAEATGAGILQAGNAAAASTVGRYAVGLAAVAVAVGVGVIAWRR